jgi:hypothetical protein
MKGRRKHLRDRLGVLLSGSTPIVIVSDLLVFTAFYVSRSIVRRVSLCVALTINVDILLFVFTIFNEVGLQRQILYAAISRSVSLGTTAAVFLPSGNIACIKLTSHETCLFEMSPIRFYNLSTNFI